MAGSIGRVWQLWRPARLVQLFDLSIACCRDEIEEPTRNRSCSPHVVRPAMKMAAGIVAMVLLAACGTPATTVQSPRVGSASASPSPSTSLAAEPAVAVVDWTKEGRATPSAWCWPAGK